MRIVQRTYLLFIIPIIVLLLSALLADLRGPFHLTRYLDPDYAYLFNSLSILSFVTPGHADHPGTTLQLLGAGVVFAKWVAGGAEPSLPGTVISHPEDYLRAISIFLNLIIAAVAYLAARKVYTLSNSLLAAVVLQLSPFLYSEVWIALSRVSPEPLMIAVSFALTIPILGTLLGKESSPRLAGALLGFGIVTKITFGPIAAIVIVFRNWRQRLWFCLSAIAAMIVLVIPIRKQMGTVFHWFWALLTHAGTYGGGAQGVPDAPMLTSNLKSLFHAEPYFFYFLFYYFAVLLALAFLRTNEDASLASSAKAVLFAVVLSMALQIAITVKHYNSRYALPALVITALANSILVVLLRSSVFERRTRAALASVGALLLLLAAGHSYQSTRVWAAEARDYRDRIAMLDQKRSADPDCVSVGSSSSSLPASAVLFGSLYTFGQYAKVMDELYPAAFTFHETTDVLSIGRQPRHRQLADILGKGGCAFLEGTRPTMPSIGKGMAGFALEPVAETPEELLYRVKPGISSTVETLDVSSAAAVIEAENFTSGNVVGDTKVFGAGIGVITSPQASAQARYIVSLPVKKRYRLWFRYASNERRPVTVAINGKRVSESACWEPTGGYSPSDQEWADAGTFEFNRGQNTIELQRNGPLPHIDKMALLPASQHPDPPGPPS